MPRQLAARLPLAAGLLALAGFVVFAATTRGFFTVDNVKAIVTSASLVGIVAVGMSFIVLSGNLFSLSLGVTAAVSAIAFVALLSAGLLPAIVLTLLLASAICGLQGVLVGGWQANPIVVTIGAGAIQQGVVVWLTGGASVLAGAGAASYAVLVDPVAGIPVVVFFFAAVVIAGDLLVRTTRFGREVQLLGDNRRAAYAAGLRVTALGAGVFAVAGLCAGICGVLLGAQSGRGELMLQGTLTFDALAAVLVGGNAISGGHGSIWRTALGALAIACITDLLLLRGADTGMQLLVKGCIVAIVVVLVHLQRRRS